MINNNLLPKIPLRIKKIAELVENNSSVCDVGSDHGYLLILLNKQGKITKGVGIENKKGPFTSLEKNLAIYNIKNVEASFSDGLDELTEEYDTLVLAGMGFSNIKSIIEKNQYKLKYIDNIITDSHTEIANLRKYFINLGFYIDNEIILKENGIFYELISFKKGDQYYSDLEIKYGPILLKERKEIFLEKYEKQLNKLTSLFSSLKNIPKKEEIKKEIEEIEFILKGE